MRRNIAWGAAGRRYLRVGTVPYVSERADTDADVCGQDRALH